MLMNHDPEADEEMRGKALITLVRIQFCLSAWVRTTIVAP